MDFFFFFFLASVTIVLRTLCFDELKRVVSYLVLGRACCRALYVHCQGAKHELPTDLHFVLVCAITLCQMS